ncbi:hypothetical protein NPIL_669701 [Nephila pilipes]|uniref:Uncharacterized protein n=1 Tax=Nephila pilipes TaxID=299642 RepID=A0A8X6P2U0_NEPPI|nr:hypothetical protein NPIL_669701 [Nephila pilipes]
MADKISAANHDAKEYGTFSNAKDTHNENNEKQQVLDSYLYRGRDGPTLTSIGLLGDNNSVVRCPPRSPDYPPVDSFSRCAMKNMVYETPVSCDMKLA